MLVAIYRDRGAFEGFRSWTGPRPYADDGFEAHAIARLIGYRGDFGADAFLELDADEAVATARFFVESDMVHPVRRPVAPATLQAIEQAVSALGSRARFFSNAAWHRRLGWEPPAGEGRRVSSMTFQPLSKATFDGGLIGLNDDHAFIFWVEQED